ESIWENRIKGKTLSEIAAMIGRSIATVSRELKRHSISNPKPTPKLTAPLPALWSKQPGQGVSYLQILTIRSRSEWKRVRY
ncbi:MAG: helix-turn-helix domain-containing protein, partial [Angelakisella sp.]|nr:helix-turn-helix domain-containing protein [Angelakisella sp.]